MGMRSAASLSRAVFRRQPISNVRAWFIARAAGRAERVLWRGVRGIHASRTTVATVPRRAPGSLEGRAVATFPAQPDSTAAARRMVRHCLADWKLSGVADVVQLVVSELVANAVTHGAPGPSAGATVVVEAQRFERGLRVTVTDGRPDAVPVVRAAGADEESGRGLRMVATVSSAWGWRPVAQGRSKQVWAEFEFDMNPPKDGR
ncbi:ATP-binding protein [Streptomyces sp. NPDC127098]|uniref:ATP-binding protein n=1 Tax=Streptomyces sp. NPDC127098 TaxID=3347137 RepID=UPI00364D4F00